MNTYAAAPATLDDIRRAGLETVHSDAERVYWEFMLGFPSLTVPHLTLTKRHRLAKLYRRVAGHSSAPAPPLVQAIFDEYERYEAAMRQASTTLPSAQALAERHRKVALQQVLGTGRKGIAAAAAKAVVDAYFTERRSIKLAKEKVRNSLTRNNLYGPLAKVGIQTGGHVLYTTGRDVYKFSRHSPR